MKCDIWDVSIRVSVPSGTEPATVQKMLTEMLAEAQYHCESDFDIIKWIESADIVKKSEFTIHEPEFECSEGTDLDCFLDMGKATCIGDKNNSCYYEVFEDQDGEWWLSVFVHHTSGRFEDLTEGDGPYETEIHAKHAGFTKAANWCKANDVNWKAYRDHVGREVNQKYLNAFDAQDGD